MNITSSYILEEPKLKRLNSELNRVLNQIDGEDYRNIDTPNELGNLQIITDKIQKIIKKMNNAIIYNYTFNDECKEFISNNITIWTQDKKQYFLNFKTGTNMFWINQVDLNNELDKNADFNGFHIIECQCDKCKKYLIKPTRVTKFDQHLVTRKLVFEHIEQFHPELLPDKKIDTFLEETK